MQIITSFNSATSAKTEKPFFSVLICRFSVFFGFLKTDVGFGFRKTAVSVFGVGNYTSIPIISLAF